MHSPHRTPSLGALLILCTVCVAQVRAVLPAVLGELWATAEAERRTMLTRALRRVRRAAGGGA